MSSNPDIARALDVCYSAGVGAARGARRPTNTNRPENRMSKTIKLFVYGHYDSRGGTTGVNAPTREAADKIYGSAFDWKPSDGWESPAIQGFIGYADIEVP